MSHKTFCQKHNIALPNGYCEECAQAILKSVAPPTPPAGSDVVERLEKFIQHGDLDQHATVIGTLCEAAALITRLEGMNANLAKGKAELHDELARLEAEKAKMREALEFVLSQESHVFAECLVAEQIMDTCRRALSTSKDTAHD